MLDSGTGSEGWKKPARSEADIVAHGRIFDQLDLSRVMIKARELMKLTNEQADVLELWYRRHLWLCYKYPGKGNVPVSAVDEVWHCHILFTRAYMADCDRIFGRYLHHNPHVGAEKDDPAHAANFQRTAHRFQEEFGEDMLVLRSRFPDQPLMAKSGPSQPHECDDVRPARAPCFD